eukprot:1159197-Pelagomonas_calceolata.AAC.1
MVPGWSCGLLWGDLRPGELACLHLRKETGKEQQCKRVVHLWRQQLISIQRIKKYRDVGTAVLAYSSKITQHAKVQHYALEEADVVDEEAIMSRKRFRSEAMMPSTNGVSALAKGTCLQKEEAGS